MYIGHFGLAFAAKNVAPRISLGTLFGAAVFVDLLWPILLAAGVEHVRILPDATRLTPLDFYDYPISHSLLAVCAWSLLLGTGYFLVRRYTKGAIVVALLVASHWLLDALVHRPDLPLTLHGGTRIGAGLWNHPASALFIEGLIFALGVFLYGRATVSVDRVGTHALWPMLGLMLITWVMSFIGPPPPSVTAIITVALATSIYLPWGSWVNRHRDPRKAARHGVKLFTAHRVGI